MKDLDFFRQFALGGSKGTDSDNRRTVIYSRVSTKGQEDNTSLANQYETCLSYVRREGLEVVSEFGGKGESAKQGSARQEYERMLKYVRTKRNRIRYVVFYAYDRFSREGGRAIVTKQELKKMGIIVKSATMPIDTSTPYGEGMEDMQLIFAKMENDVRRKRCTDGIKSRLREGRWCCTAPTGYKMVNGFLEIDPVKGPMIKKAFKWKRDEPGITLDEIRRRLAKLGLKVPRQSMTRIIRNPIYCGLIVHRMLEGDVVEGRHKPIVPRKLFLEVNGILKTGIASGWRKDEENAMLPLKRFMTCECCGKPLTGYLNKTKNGKLRPKPIPYYKCRTSGCKVSLNANVMGEDFLKHLDRYHIDPNLVPVIAHELRTSLLEVNDERFREGRVMEARIKEMDKKIQRLRERYVMEEAINRDDYVEFSERLKDERAELKAELYNIRQKSSNLLEQIEDVIRISANLGQIWRKGTYRDKQRVQKMAFPDGLVYSPSKRKLLTPRINEMIRLSSEYSTLLTQKRKGQARKVSNLSRLVAQGGVEPPTSGL